MNTRYELLNWPDACLRPEALLSEREEQWKICWKTLHEIGDYEGKRIVLKYCDEDYSSVRIFKKLRIVLEKMIQILPFPRIQSQLQRKRYDLEDLRSKSHLHILRSNIEMQQMAKLYVKAAWVEILKVEHNEKIQ